ncbi:MAG: hypothetical protein A3I05_03390 [Deltaproteobacteria bacterium RIFCSPLOWO2_02_FULL_44_10]|nr:MAG: hypothetical protein A3C46_02965 [Deltaproteobacteria bacterium RIFCSPHIGHO2_02_FULL_44_16]OGQ46217.1 MAG: hypothetical protein A3I05_03390 [Deltaproteobacteria bacterium RIFCSPLOWO2_02_FULL_44_10]
MSEAMTHRHQMVAALAAMLSQDIEDFLPHLADDEAQLLRRASVFSQEQGNRETEARKQIQLLKAQQAFHGLAEIHPAWILEELEHESPRVIGMILRYLPSRHVRSVLEHLPSEIKSRLPDMVEVFAVRSELLEVIRKRFEARFLPMRCSRSSDSFTYEEFAAFKSEDLETLFFDLGIHEMAIALSSVSSKPLRMLLNRLPLKEAKRLQLRIRELSDVSLSLRHQAQFLIINVANEYVGAKKLFFELGICAFARSLGNNNENVVRMIQQKLKPEYGYILKRAVTEWSDVAQDEMTRERQKIVEERIAALAAAHLIDTSWLERCEESTQSEPKGEVSLHA